MQVGLLTLVALPYNIDQIRCSSINSSFGFLRCSVYATSTIISKTIPLPIKVHLPSRLVQSSQLLGSQGSFASSLYQPINKERRNPGSRSSASYEFWADNRFFDRLIHGFRITQFLFWWSSFGCCWVWFAFVGGTFDLNEDFFHWDMLKLICERSFWGLARMLKIGCFLLCLAL